MGSSSSKSSLSYHKKLHRGETQQKTQQKTQQEKQEDIQRKKDTSKSMYNYAD